MPGYPFASLRNQVAWFGIRALTGDPMSDHIPIQEAELDCLRASREELILQIRHAQEIIERSQELLLLLEQMLAEAGPPVQRSD